jgi:glycosyltransferase involved in cell wall biosynthesis
MTYIVTVTYNDAENLRFTLKSVLKNKKDFQRYIVIDGASKDDTSKIVQEYESVIDGYISEPDKGLYDAMNKIERFEISDSDYIIWINAGDELTDWGDFDPSHYKDINSIFAAVIKKSERGTSQTGIIVVPKIYTPYNEKSFYPKTLYQHQGFLVKYGLFKQLKYNLDIGLQAENLLMSQCVVDGDYLSCDFPVSVYYTDGVSNNSTIRLLKSYFRVAKHLGFSQMLVLLYHFIFVFKAIVYGMLPKVIKEKYRRYKYQ